MESFIPFACIRNVSKSGFSKLKVLFSKTEDQKYDFTVLAFGSDCPRIDILKKTSNGFVKRYYGDGEHLRQFY